MLTEEKLTEYLLNKYHPLAIILHGSRASGRNRPHSDWDLILLVDKDTPTEQAIIDGSAIDVEALRPDIENQRGRLKEIGGAFHSVKILFDTDSIGERFIARVQELTSAGFKITSEEYNSRKSFLFRLLNRLIDAGNEHPIEFAYHFGNFLQRAINYSFQVNGRWSKSIYEAVEDIKKNNLELAKELNTAISNVSNTEKIETAKRIYKLIFKENFIL